MHPLVEQLESHQRAQGLTRKELANRLGVPQKTLEGWLAADRSGNNPSAANRQKITAYLRQAGSPPPQMLPLELEAEKEEVKPTRLGPEPRQEAKIRAQKVKYLLLLLEDELSWFKKNSQIDRDAFRSQLDPYDVGYISSLLNMLRQEDSFQRWLTLSTNKFCYFRKRRSKDGQEHPN